MLTIAATGLTPHAWPSVTRTFQVYRDALDAMGATVHHVPDTPVPASGTDLLMNFSGDAGWEIAAGTRDFPCLFSMHGGCVLDRGFLRKSLPTLTAGDALIVNCSSDAAVMRALLEDAAPALEVLPLPVDSVLFVPGDRASARSQLGLTDDDFCIGIVARLLPQKNVHGALEVVRDLISRNPGKQVRIVIVGNFWADYAVLRFDVAPYPDYLRQLIDDYGLSQLVRYLPAKLSDAELAQVYRSLDVLLHPTNSIDENFGYAPVEAMASGVPVVGCAYGGLKDTVVDGVTGFLAPTWLSFGGLREDRGALVHGLEVLMRDRDKARELSLNARRHIEQHYTREHCIGILQDIVLRSAQEWPSRSRRPLSVRPPRDMRAYDRYLTPVHDRLSSFAGSISHYVSASPPTVTGDLGVQTYSSYTESADATITLTNPAWPATYPVSPRQHAILRRCRIPAAAALLLNDGYTAAELDEMLAQGMLVTAVLQGETV